MVGVSPANDQNVEDVEISDYRLNEFTADWIEIDVSFKQPLLISSKSLPDRLNLTFLNHEYFRLAARPFISVGQNSSIFKVIPR